jgi:hypothetical protein
MHSNEDHKRDGPNREGGTNFSKDAWFQGNSARVFRSTVRAQAFIK